MSAVAIVIAGCLAVLALDLVGGLLARRIGFRYVLLTPLSLLLYAATGFLAARAADVWIVGSVGGAAAAATDATVGWRISRRLGLDREDAVSEGMEAGVATVVTLSGMVVGTLAGLLA
ncbi:MAG TPA: hypothetical protein VNO82_06290 [Solirubrobacteraceae bacterium]|nr:hypothetical protein [Solirubrobacteraceae bacterium]